MVKAINMFLLLTAVAAVAPAGENIIAVTDPAKSPIVEKKSTLPPIITEKYEYYEVCGCCEKDLKCELNKKCIRWNDGKKYDSITDWKLKWDYGRNRADGACAADAFTVKVDIVFHLPRWMQAADAPKQLVAKWEMYHKNLLVHEQGHRDIAVAAAKGFTQAVEELPPVRTCNELDRDIREITARMGKKLIEDQKEYDAVTEHGRTQGALFP